MGPLLLRSHLCAPPQPDCIHSDLRPHLPGVGAVDNQPHSCPTSLGRSLRPPCLCLALCLPCLPLQQLRFHHLLFSLSLALALKAVPKLLLHQAFLIPLLLLTLSPGLPHTTLCWRVFTCEHLERAETIFREGGGSSLFFFFFLIEVIVNKGKDKSKIVHSIHSSVTKSCPVLCS